MLSLPQIALFSASFAIVRAGLMSPHIGSRSISNTSYSNARKHRPCPNNKHRAANPQCCVFYDLLDDIQDNLLTNECTLFSHLSIRLAFHDAIGFSPALTAQGEFGGGGADGSIIAFNVTEQQDPANDLGTATIAQAQKLFADAHNVSYGDIVQFAAAVALTNCDGGPRVPFYGGRPDAQAASPPNLIPLATDSVPDILARMADAGFSGRELVALLASHGVAAQAFVDPTVPGSPLDSTPTSFDTQFYIETQLRGTTFPGNSSHPGEVEAPLKGELRLQSDHNLARDDATSCDWQSFANDADSMRTEFTAAMLKMALLGQNVDELIDCSEVIPNPKDATVEPHIPSGLSQDDIEQACATSAYPSLPVESGAIETVAPVPFPPANFTATPSATATAT